MKLTKLLKEIKITTPGKTILWGYTSNGRFTELVKLRGFRTSQEALDKINELLGYRYNDEDGYYTSDSIDNPSYAYLADDGQVSFVKSLSEFSGNWETEEDWRVNKWSKNPPRFN